ncbi:MAG TPA: hypothetical protein VET65_10410 [Candidatus Limnocylindrales bacterium]|nr:hypothetical protein [Candidatus Limnocylindrales bacterium]
MVDERVFRARRLPVEIFRALAESVVRQAVMDLHHDVYREDARRFFDGRSFDAYCGILGWNSRRARANLQARLDGLMYRDPGDLIRHPAVPTR